MAQDIGTLLASSETVLNIDDTEVNTGAAAGRVEIVKLGEGPELSTLLYATT